MPPTANIKSKKSFMVEVHRNVKEASIKQARNFHGDYQNAKMWHEFSSIKACNKL